MLCLPENGNNVNMLVNTYLITGPSSVVIWLAHHVFHRYVVGTTPASQRPRPELLARNHTGAKYGGRSSHCGRGARRAARSPMVALYRRHPGLPRNTGKHAREHLCWHQRDPLASSPLRQWQPLRHQAPRCRNVQPRFLNAARCPKSSKLRLNAITQVR